MQRHEDLVVFAHEPGESDVRLAVRAGMLVALRWAQGYDLDLVARVADLCGIKPARGAKS